MFKILAVIYMKFRLIFLQFQQLYVWRRPQPPPSVFHYSKYAQNGPGHEARTCWCCDGYIHILKLKLETESNTILVAIGSQLKFVIGI